MSLLHTQLGSAAPKWPKNSYLSGVIRPILLMLDSEYMRHNALHGMCYDIKLIKNNVDNQMIVVVNC